MSSLHLDITGQDQALPPTDKHKDELMGELIAQMSDEEASPLSGMPALENIDRILTMLKGSDRPQTAKSLDISAQRRPCCIRPAQTPLSTEMPG